MINKKLEALAKMQANSGKDKTNRELTELGVEKCKAPFGCEAIQYKCHSWKCYYNGSKSYWPDDPKERYAHWSQTRAPLSDDEK